MEQNTTQEPIKVYELAKELGLDSLTLVDRLGSLNIKVKNHMSELSTQDVEAARTALTKKTTGTKSGTKTAAKSTTPKTLTKTAPKAAAKSTAGATEEKPKKAATTRKKATPAESAAATAAAAAAAAAEQALAAAKSASTIIRRRVRSDGDIETVTSKTMPAESTSSSETAAPEFTEEVTAETLQAVETPVEATEVATEELAATEVTTPEITEAAPVPPTRAKVVLPPRPVAPRRSILTIVQAAAPPPKPMIKPAPGAAGTKTVVGGKTVVKGTTITDKDGFRVVKMTKENLDQMVEEENAKKKVGGGRGTEVEVKPEDVKFADYRKKELVFLPKRKRIPTGRELKRTEITTPKAIKRIVEMGETITVSDFASQLSVKAPQVIRKLMNMGQMVTINQSIDFDTATLLAAEFQFEVKNIAFKEDTILSAESQASAGTMTSRPPVVTIMGHVDHGKTSLLDALRSANVAAGEAGGITQHIGAYTVEKDGHFITFIDTPGHEAFTVMRARGANVTDIVILVVAADDGVMPQTREALSHAKAAGVPIIVAVNKMDKPGALPERVKQQLAELDLLAEDWGGQTMFIPVSAIKRTGLDKLQEAILLQSEVLELKADSELRANGTVLEARIERGRGPVASVLVRKGTLRVGDPIVSGTCYGRVRAMMDDKGRQVKETTPGYAVEVLGFVELPNAGEPFDSPASDSDAQKVVEHRKEKIRIQNAGTAAKMSLDDLFAKVKTGAAKELPVILKADVFGSVEAIRDSLLKLSTEKVKIKVILSSPGGITENDVLLASASNALIIGFNVRPETKARQIAESEHVEIKTYSIIYELIEDVRNAMVGVLDKKKVEKYLGRAEVRQTFVVPKIGTIAGCSVVDGKILRGANIRLLRDSRIIFDGKLSSLKRFKDDAKEVAQGYECGIGVENYNDLKMGDLIEAYQIDLVTPEL